MAKGKLTATEWARLRSSHKVELAYARLARDKRISDMLPKVQGARAQELTLLLPSEQSVRDGRNLLNKSGGPHASARDAVIEGEFKHVKTKPQHWTKRGLRTAIRTAQRMNQVNKMLDLIDLWAKLGFGIRKGVPSFGEPPGWRKCDGDYAPNPLITSWDGMRMDFGSIDCHKRQLNGQAYYGPFVPMSALQAGGEISFADSGRYLFANWGRPDGYGNEHSSWYRIDGQAGGPVTFQVKGSPHVALDTPLNPNLTRMLAPDAQPLDQAVYQPEITNHGQSWPELAASTISEDLVRQYVSQVPESHAFAVGGRNEPPTKTPTVPREPPGRREKQRKNISRSAVIGVALYKALDTVSETADIVDAVYDALPEDVKKRWDRPNRRGVDQFGQYGLNGADWKLQVIWHNAHRLDTEKAWRNIAKNLLEDEIYGQVHRRVPRGVGGPAFEEQWRAFHKRVLTPLLETLD